MPLKAQCGHRNGHRVTLSNYTRLTTYKAELDHTKTSAICYLRGLSLIIMQCKRHNNFRILINAQQFKMCCAWS